MAEYYKGEKLAEVGTGTPLTAAQQAAEIDASRKSAAASNTIPEPQVTSGLDRRNRNINDVAQAVAQDNQAITSDNLKQNGSVYIPPTQSQTAAAAVTGAAQSATEQYINNQALQAKKEFDAASSKNQSLQDEYLGIQRSRAGLEESAKIPELSKQANDAYTALQASQRAQANELRALDKAGMTDVGRQAAERGINRKYAFEQADLNISLDVANRAYSLAQANVDRKIELQLEPLKTLIGFQEGILNRADNKLTQATQNKLGVLLEQNKREYESEKDRLKTLEDTKLKALIEAQTAGADATTLANIQRAETPEDVILAGGQYIGAQQRFENEMKMLQYQSDEEYRQAQIRKIQSEIGDPTFDGYLDEKETAKVDASPQGKKIKSLGDLKQKLNNYRDLVSEYGTETPFGGQKSSLDAAYADLKIAYKTAAELGALTGPDVELLEQAIKPASFGGLLAPVKRAGAVASGQGKGSILAGIDQTLKSVDANAKTNIDQLKARDPRYEAAYYIDELTAPFKSLTEVKSIDQYINQSPENLERVKSLRQKYPDWTEQDYMQVLQPTSFNQGSGGTPIATVKEIKDGSKVSTIMGSGIATGIVNGSKVWKPGLDLVLSGGKGAPVKAPFEGTIISAKKENGWGNSVKIKTADGRIVRLSHLNNINVKPGQKITAGTVVGGQGNTGTTYGKTGIHVDVTVYKPDGKPMTSQEVAALLGIRKA